MAQVHWLLAGHPLYTEPSLEYVPILYGPLYAYVSSAFVFILGEHYGTLRLVSLLATLGTQVILGWMVWRKTRSLLGAWVAAGLYAGMYGATGFYYDMARVDALYIFLTTAAICAIWIAAEKGGAATLAAAVAATGAVLTKQTALFPIVALCLWSLILNTKKARTTALLCLGSVLASQTLPALMGNSWFFYYLYKVPSTHPILTITLHDFIREISKHMSVGLALSACTLFLLFQQPHSKRDASFFLLFTLAMLVASILPRLKVGGDINNLMPLAVVIALCCGLTVGMTRNSKSRYSLFVVFALLCFNIQIFYLPCKALPAPGALAQTKTAIKVFRQLETPIFAPFQAYLPLLAGKNASAFWMPIRDILFARDQSGDLLQRKLRKALEEKKFRNIVLPTTLPKQYNLPYLLDNYQPRNSDGANKRQEIMCSFSIYIPKE